MITLMDQQQKLAVDTATRIQKYLSSSWTADGQEAEAVKEISAKVADSIREWLLALHGPTSIVSEAAAAAKKTIWTHCYDDESENIKDMYEEAISAINDLHNKDTATAATAKAAKQAEKEAANAKKAAAREKAAAEKAAKQAKDKEDKEQRKIAAMAAKKALQNFRPEEYDEIKFEEMKKGDVIKFDNVAGYTDVYPVYDLSYESLYVIEGYTNNFKPEIISIDLDQFHVLKEGIIVFIDEYDYSNQANITCYRP